MLFNMIKDAAFQALLHNTSDMIFVKDINLIYVAASSRFVEMAGKAAADEIIGKTDFEIFENEELARRYTDDDRKLLNSNENLIRYIEPLTDKQGYPRYSSTSKYILYDMKDRPIGILGVSRDITKEMMARQRHQKELQYLFALPEDTYAALFMDIDDWRIIHHQRRNSGNHIIPICETLEDFAENALNCLAPPISPRVSAFYHNLSKETLLEICDKGTRTTTLEYPRRMPNGEILWVMVTINFLLDPENGHHCAIWTLRNIHQQKQDTIDLRHAAEHDEMTGLLNRSSTTKYIQQTLQEKKLSSHALFIVDVDNFKSLNDTLGHQEGDKFLVSLSTMLKNCYRESDIVGRIGGDEFFILMKNVPNHAIITEKAETMMSLSKLLCGQYPDLQLSLSIGISLYPENGTTLDQLYQHADRALYQAKKSGKKQFVFT